MSFARPTLRATLGTVVLTAELLSTAVVSAAPRPGVAPDGPWSCPTTHPIKGYLSQTGRRVYFMPGTPFYDEASPERCYGTEDDARQDGADPSRDGVPRLRRDDFVQAKFFPGLIGGARTMPSRLVSFHSCVCCA
jgi:hypothetical protein